ncbi:MAG: hypothetical protein QOH72_4670 [Solirubrobacteraceae bacterium]|jgi:hypothetical protein|nr:hypothetical protein [Solirubrobacteraceae bacterium]
MLTATKALELAGRHQLRAVRDAAGYAASLGEPVGFLQRRVAGGMIFEAVALDSARTCAVIDEHGGLGFVTGERPGGAFRRPAPARFRASIRRTAEAALVAAARPRGDEPA